MMKHTAIAALVAAATMVAPAAAKDTVTFAYLADPSHEAVMWALKNGKVTSDLIEVQADALQIPALIQGTATRAYDVVQTAGMAIPRLRNRGLDLRIIGTALRYHAHGEGADIWVPADSDIQSAADLKGKRLATYSLGSSGVTLARVALANSHGLNVDLEGGDLEFVEMPAPGMPAALSAGRVDAAMLIHAQAFEAQKTGAFRSVVSTAVDNHDEFGVRMVSAVLGGYGDKLDAEPEKYQEFMRLLHESVEYAKANPDEVFTAVAEETGTPKEFFEKWFSEFSDFPALISQDDRKAIETLWQEAEKLGILSDLPPVDETVWSETVTAESQS
ncbi:MAG: MqnA/MqnD/SBP family protein [Pseudomonadota bacterium]